MPKTIRARAGATTPDSPQQHLAAHPQPFWLNTTLVAPLRSPSFWSFIVIVRAATRKTLAHAASLQIRLLTVWTQRRSTSGTTLVTLTVAFMMAINKQQAPLLRALVKERVAAYI